MYLICRAMAAMESVLPYLLAFQFFIITFNSFYFRRLICFPLISSAILRSRVAKTDVVRWHKGSKNPIEVEIMMDMSVSFEIR